MNRSQKKLFTTLLLFAALALMPMSCNWLCQDSCGCGPSPKPQELRIKSLMTTTLDEKSAEIPPTQQKPFDQVFTGLRVKEAEIKTQASKPEIANSFGTAFACSPIPPTTANSLYLIQIINQKEFTLDQETNFPVGADLTPLFGMAYLYVSDLTTIPQFTAAGLQLTLDSYFKIGLLKSPQQDLDLEFTIRLRFDDGQEFSLPDQILRIKG